MASVKHCLHGEHRTQRWEAHIWQEGKQIYLGGFDAEEQAALAYDLAALKFRGPDAQINFDISNYEQELLHFNDVSSVSLFLPRQRINVRLGQKFCEDSCSPD